MLTTCRRILFSAGLAEGRLSLTPQGRVRQTLKTPYRDGTTHVVFAPLDFMARLTALVPKPRVDLTRYHGVFAPHSRWRAQVTPAERHRAMTWAQRLKGVFQLDLDRCEGCGGQVRVVACLQDPLVIHKILDPLARSGSDTAGEGQRPEVLAVPAEFGNNGRIHSVRGIPNADPAQADIPKAREPDVAWTTRPCLTADHGLSLLPCR